MPQHSIVGGFNLWVAEITFENLSTSATATERFTFDQASIGTQLPAALNNVKSTVDSLTDVGNTLDGWKAINVRLWEEHYFDLTI